MKYTIKNLHSEFNSDKKCLQFIFNNRYDKKFECPDCKKTGKFYLIESRKRFDCACGYTISPLADTIFHKSSTPLTLWFHAIFLFASSRNGVAALEPKTLRNIGSASIQNIPNIHNHNHHGPLNLSVI